MKVTTYNPLLPSKTFGSFVDDFFNGTIADFFGSDLAVSSPAVNVIETADHFRLELAAPGLEKTDFSLTVDNGSLLISAERKQEKEVNEQRYTRKEFNYTAFRRRFQLPDTLDVDSIGAVYENGILLVTIPKKEKAKVQETRYIEIK